MQTNHCCSNDVHLNRKVTKTQIPRSRGVTIMCQEDKTRVGMGCIYLLNHKTRLRFVKGSCQGYNPNVRMSNIINNGMKK